MTGTTAPQQSKDATIPSPPAPPGVPVALVPTPSGHGRRWGAGRRPRARCRHRGRVPRAVSAATASSGNSGAAAQGRPPGGLARPTVAGKVTALSGDTVTIETNAKASVTVITSSSTTYKTNPGPNGGTSTSASAVKVGVFVGVQGTKNSDGTVTATSVVIGRPPQMGQGGAGRVGAPGRPVRHAARRCA